MLFGIEASISSLFDTPHERMSELILAEWILLSTLQM